jgi:hypothetical protein
MEQNRKDNLIDAMYYTALVLWGLSILLGALVGSNSGSAYVGAFKGFIIGLGIVILNKIIVRSIEEPGLLLAFVILPLIGYLIGLIWGDTTAFYGAAIGLGIAIVIVADMVKKD